MSYTKNVSAGKKVTVNVAEISPVGSTDGYFGNSLVVNPMPAQNITRDILLNVLKFDVHLNVVYGNNTVNPGQSVSAYNAYIQPDDSTPGQRMEINGTRRMFINVANGTCPDFTIYDVKREKIVYWEHFGCMDNPEYARKACEKIMLYVANGIIPSIDLIITFETKDNPLTAEKVMNVINEYFG
jgi:hypothetical protein